MLFNILNNLMNTKIREYVTELQFENRLKYLERHSGH